MSDGISGHQDIFMPLLFGCVLVFIGVVLGVIGSLVVVWWIVGR